MVCFKGLYLLYLSSTSTCNMNIKVSCYYPFLDIYWYSTTLNMFSTLSHTIIYNYNFFKLQMVYITITVAIMPTVFIIIPCPFQISLITAFSQKGNIVHTICFLFFCNINHAVHEACILFIRLNFTLLSKEPISNYNFSAFLAKIKITKTIIDIWSHFVFKVQSQNKYQLHYHFKSCS